MGKAYQRQEKQVTFSDIMRFLINLIGILGIGLFLDWGGLVEVSKSHVYFALMWAAMDTIIHAVRMRPTPVSEDNHDQG